MIVGFRDKRTEVFCRGRRVAAFSGLARTASRRLDQLDAATGLGDLARPGNRLEALKGRRRGQWSIRINDQWRICFEWPDGAAGPAEVEIVDYHKQEVPIGVASGGAIGSVICMGPGLKSGFRQ